MNYYVLLIVDHLCVFSRQRTLPSNRQFFHYQRRLSQFQQKHPTQQIGIGIFSSKDVNSLLSDVGIVLTDHFIIVNAIVAPFVKYWHHFVLGESLFQLTGHRVDGELAPILFIEVVGHEVIQKVVVVPDSTRNYDEFAICTLTVKCSQWHLIAGKILKLDRQIPHIDDADSVGNYTHPMLEELHASEKQHLLVGNHAALALPKGLQLANQSCFSPSIGSRLIGDDGCMFPSSKEIDFVVDVDGHAIIVDVGFVAEEVPLVNFLVQIKFDGFEVFFFCGGDAFALDSDFLVHSGRSELSDPFPDFFPFLGLNPVAEVGDLMVLMLVGNDFDFDEGLQLSGLRPHFLEAGNYIVPLSFVYQFEGSKGFGILLGQLDEGSVQVGGDAIHLLYVLGLFLESIQEGLLGFVKD